MRLVYLAFGWVCGIVLAANSPVSSSSLSLAWLLLCGAAGACVRLLRDRWLWPSLVLLALTLGGLRMSLAPTGSELAGFNNLGGVSLEGVVSAAPELRDRDMRVRVSVSSLTMVGETYPVQGEVLVLAAVDPSLRPGDRLRATGLLQQPGEFDRFSWSDFLARSGVFSVLRDATLEVKAEARPLNLQSILYDLNQTAGRHVTSLLPAPWSALLKGILLGDERSLPPGLREAFNATGAAHVIAISGFNMIVLAGVVRGLLRRTRLPPGLAAAIAVLVILLYSFLVGAGAAVMRAALMSCLLIVAGVLRRPVFTPASLAFAVLLLSAENPTVLWDIGFQLSVFATLGIMVLVAPLDAGLKRILQWLLPAGAGERAQNLLTEPLVVSLAAWMATFPLILRYFGRLSLVTLPVNLLVVPAQAPLLMLGLLATLVAFFAPGPAQLLFWLGLVPLGWTVQVVTSAARLPLASVEVLADPRLVAAGYFLLIAAATLRALRHPAALRLARSMIRHAGGVTALALAACLVLLLVATRASRPDGLLHLWLLDVGQANGILMQGPAGEHILIDGGDSPSRLLAAVGERLPFYDRRLEVLAVTVPDLPAVDSLQSLLQRYDVGLLLHNGQRELPTALTGSADTVITPVAGYRLELGQGLEIRVLHPQTRPPPEQRQLNNSALVLQVSYKSLSFLLPGTLDTTGQQELLAAGGLSPVTVLQLPLQGSPRSLEADFLSRSGAQQVIAHWDPDDWRNRAGGLDPDVLAMLGETPLHGDSDGTLHLWSDGVRLWRDLWPRQQPGG